MSIGSILVGLAIVLIVVVYVVRPFRVVIKSTNNPSHVIESWITQTKPSKTASVNFCTQCGRRVGPEDRFCAGCGTLLREDGG